jgi:hypothetical protein
LVAALASNVSPVSSGSGRSQFGGRCDGDAERAEQIPHLGDLAGIVAGDQQLL